MANPVVHFEVLGRDAKKLQDFYTKLFGWKVGESGDSNYGLVEPVGSGIGGGVGAGDAPSVTVYVEVPDPGETLRQAEAMAGQTVMPPTDLPGDHVHTIAQFKDPEGNLIGLISGH
jgi:predicted enzyme related to lactoylglutathione lyase